MFSVLSILLMVYGATSMILRPSKEEEEDIVRKVKKDKVKEIIEEEHDVTDISEDSAYDEKELMEELELAEADIKIN